MRKGFTVFSTERGPSIDPASLAPQPATLIDLAYAPALAGNTYDPNAGKMGRGSRTQTFGGAVDQDFGVTEQDRVIRIAVADMAMGQALIDQIDAMYAAPLAQYYFSDGVRCWLAKFVKPDGWKWWENLAFAYDENYDGPEVFSFELLLKVDSREI
jgi:hypothetical protein